MRNLAIIFLLVASFLLSSCGSDSEDTVVVTYIVTVSQGDIAQITYFDGSGNEINTQGVPGRRTFTTTFGTTNGNFLFITARSSLAGELINISARILSNGTIIAEGSEMGEDGSMTPPVVDIEGFAVSNQNTEGN